MSSDRWERMWVLFHEAVAEPPEEREAFLDRVCEDDPELRAELSRLLDNHDGAPSVLDPLVASEDGSDDPLVGSRIDHYRIEQVIGRGGMGTVYEASQEQPIKRRVALKLITRGMDTREVVARFESERQALALMDHPNIAKVFDAGSTAEGRPYFVMEMVDGRPVTEFCDGHRLGIRRRIELLVPVCQAVQHAHQKGVIHRDLKPSNILVGGDEPLPRAKVIDFGIAKAVHGRLTDRTLATVLGRAMGTPEYMSPEQATEAADVDTRTDVYSLGVVLFELLVGRLPFEISEGRKRGAGEIVSTTRGLRLATPSGKLGTLGVEAQTVADLRGTDAVALRRELHGELDWIVMRALEEDRERRYGTAAELAADLERFLNHQPVSAGPPGAGYRLRTFLRRHRFGVAAAAGLVLALLLGTIGTAWMALEASRERRAAVAARDRAQEEADTARAVIGLLDDMLSAPDPNEVSSTTGANRDIKVVEVLDRATAALDDLDEKPAVEAAMRTTLGDTYLNLGLTEEAEAHFRRALELNRSMVGGDHEDSLTASHNLALALKTAGKLEEAEAILRPTFETRRRVLGPEHRDTMISALNLASLVFERGDHRQAEQLLRELIPMQQRILGEEDASTLVSMSGLSLVLSRQGKYAEAEKLARDVLELRRRVHGEEHSFTLSSMGNLATVLEDKGDLEEAEVIFGQLVDLNRRVLGDTHPSSLLTIQNLATVRSRLGRYDEAVPLLREVLELYRSEHGPDHPVVLVTSHNLARTLTQAGDAEEAVAIYRATLGDARRVLGADHYLVATFEGGLGVALQRMGDFTRAEAHLLASHSRLEAAFGPDHRRVEAAREHLVGLYDEWGRPESADRYRGPS